MIFCGVIFAFALFYFVSPKSDYSAQEKRKLSDFPEFTLEKLADGTFQSGIDDYLSDHITARNFFVGFSAEYELVTGRNGSKGIYLGSDSYLFPKPTKDSEILSQNAEYINEYAEYSSIPVYMTVIPSTGYINSDKLPFAVVFAISQEWVILLFKSSHNQQLQSYFSFKLCQIIPKA